MAIDKDKLLQAIRESDRPLGVRDVMGALSIHPGEMTETKRALRDLVRAGVLVRDGKRFSPAESPRKAELAPHQRPKPGKRERERVQRPAAPVLVYPEPEHRRRGGKDIFTGMVRKHRDGFGFVERYDGKGDDAFLPVPEAATVFDGDLVRVEVVAGPDGRTRAKLLEVVERRRQYAVGTYVDRGRQTFVLPTDPALGAMIAVPAHPEVRDGDIVKVKLIEPAQGTHGPATGEVLEKAGEPGDPYLETLRAAFAQGFSDDFPKSTLAEADRLAVPVDEAELAKRRDVRKLRLVTIDGEDARDFDDAVYVERAPAGYRLVVAIADVSHYVTEGSSLDDEALRRCTSVYFPNAVLPMLPEQLSNGICSLKPDEDRLCMVADMLLDESGQPRECELYPGVMRSHARCTYTDVAKLLEGDKTTRLEFLRPDLELGWELAAKLNKQRMERGSIDFDIPEAKIVLDEKGKIKAIEKRERNNAHRLVEEFMLAANEAVARYFSQRGLPTIFRIHAEPDEEKLAAFAELAAAHGHVVPRSGLTPKAMNDLLAAVEGEPYQRAFNSLLLRAMMQATYDAENIGHYGLAAPDYLHFTSPIRRYPDLVVHRLLRQHWARPELGGADPNKLQAIAKRCSERERAAMKAEREVDNFFGCLLLKDRVGERFPGVVASVTDFGLFVELEGLFAEGLVKAEDLGHDPDFDMTTQTLTIGSSGKSYTVGQKLEVEVRSVNLERRQTDLSLVEGGEVVERARKPRFLADALAELRGKRGGPPRGGGHPAKGEGEEQPGRSRFAREERGGRGKPGRPGREERQARKTGGGHGEGGPKGRGGRDDRGGKGGRHGGKGGRRR